MRQKLLLLLLHFVLFSFSNLAQSIDDIWLEAECGSVGSGWSIVDSAPASGGRYLLPPSGQSTAAPPVDAASMVSLDFSASSGTYAVYALVDTPNSLDDSFWVRANGGSWVKWNGIPGGGFGWRRVWDSDSGNAPVTFDLVDGANTIYFAHREDGAALDKIYLSLTGTEPTGLGQASSNCAPSGALPFVTTWKTDNPGSSGADQIRVPTFPGGVYDYEVNWGDGTSDTGVTTDIVHTYAAPGTYTVSITGDFPRIYFNNGGDREKILAIDQWGDVQWTSMERAFYGCPNLDVLASDVPDLPGVSSMSAMFEDCTSLLGNASMGNWDTGNVANMADMFRNASAFNQDIGDWDTGNVTDMQTMFFQATSFNQDIGLWNTSSVSNMNSMFANAPNFNQNIENWDVSSVMDMSGMFWNATFFNQPLGNWDVGNVSFMSLMFVNASNFNQDIGNWDVSSVRDMIQMFERATAFDQDLSAWNVGKVESMLDMFSGTKLSVENYDRILEGWSNLSNLQTGVFFDAGNSEYCSSVEARQQLIDIYGWTIIDAGENCPVGQDDIWLEAECGSVGSGWSIVDSAPASGGRYLLPPSGQSTAAPPVDAASMVSLDFSASSGTYAVYALVDTPNSLDDSFWVRANGGNWIKWNGIPGGGGFGWRRVWDSDSGNAPVTFDLVDGANTIYFAHREDGAALDKVYLSRTGGEPTGLGQTSSNCAPSGALPFVTTWKTDNPGSSGADQIRIPTFPGGVYDYEVDWGDGTSDTGVTTDIVHTYAAPGTYTVSITGDFPHIYFNNGGDREKILAIDQWGDVQWTSMEGAFYGCPNLDVLASDVPDLPGVSSMSAMFEDCTSLLGNASMGNWDTGNVANMADMFRNASAFNQDIGDWDVSSVTDMTGMFSGATSFNRPLGQWDVGKVTSMERMFSGAASFNQNISGWNTSEVRVLQAIFFGASSFNQPLGNWDLGNVSNTVFMFANASNFNQDIENWNVSSVTDMTGMFFFATSFNQPLGNWDVGNVITMNNVFIGASSFNKNIGDWDVSKVTRFNSMFEKASAFDQNLGNWDVGNAEEMENMFAQTNLSINNYDAILIGWSQLPALKNGVVLDAQNLGYCASEAARMNLIDNYGWIINDQGNQCALNGFVMEWFTGGSGSSNDNQITIPVIPDEDYDYIVDWGDGTSDTGVTTSITHTYSEIGHYTVSITGDFPGIYFSNGGDRNKIRSIRQWGGIQWTSMENAFYGCEILGYHASDFPDLSGVSSTKRMFAGCKSLTGEFTSTNMSDWNVETITDMSYMFEGVESFQMDLSLWDVSNVNTMEGMFLGTSMFNTDISDWNVVEVTNMSHMFSNSIAFNQDISDWNVSMVTTMKGMFKGAVNFDQDLGSWNIEAINDMTEMFQGTKLTTANYDGMLAGWNDLANAPTEIVFNGGLSTYCLSNEARQSLIDTKGWTIMDGGLDCSTDVASFVTVWNTENPGDSNSNQISIPTFPEAIYNYTVDWGDGEVSTNVSGDITHTYATPGIYEVRINGDFPRIYFDDKGDKEKILIIKQWGELAWTSMEKAFYGCRNLSVQSEDVPDLANVSSLGYMFARCESLESNPSFGMWDTGNIVSMEYLFRETQNFNTDISGWDVSQVTDMTGVFFLAFNFNQDIRNWDVSNVLSMKEMFFLAVHFNQDIGNWDVGNVRDTSYMFYNSFWFDQDIGRWNVENVSDMSGMFANTDRFNQDIGSWNVGKVVNMSSMFANAKAFNQDLSQWNVAGVNDMSYMFFQAFEFDQSIGSWNVGNVIDMTGMFTEVVLSDANYDDILQKWSTLPSLQNNVPFDAGSTQYCLGTESRQTLIDTYNWTILDQGQSCPIPAGEIWLEAECAIVGSFWDIMDNEEASEGQYISPNSNGSALSPPSDDRGIVTFNFTVEEGGSYKIYGRIGVPNSDEDSFWVRVNDGNWVNWKDILGNPNFNWYQVYDETISNVSNFDLTEGLNRLDIGISEGTAILDKLFITSTDNIPDSLGAVAANCPDRPFVTTWKTDIRNEFDNTITIPTIGGGYDYIVFWGDGTLDTGVTGNITHTYADPGTYEVSIYGRFPRFYPNIIADSYKLTAVNSWGDIKWRSMSDAFSNCQNLDIVASDIPDLTLVSSLQRMFIGCRGLLGNEKFGEWDVSGVRSFDGMFVNTPLFNQDLSAWNVSNGESFHSMFQGASTFNQDIGSWNMGKSKNLSYFFNGATSFNQDIGDWDVSQVTEMYGVFANTEAFNQDIGNWDVSNVTYMIQMFERATAFNQDLSAWNVGKVESMSDMFLGGKLSVENYDKLLAGWSNLPNLQTEVFFDAGNSEYCSGVEARQQLIDTYGWTIIDAGENCPIGQDEVWLEAECALVGSNWSVQEDAAASGAQYLLPPSGQHISSPPTDVNSIVTFNFEVISGEYKVFGRVNTPNSLDDSFWIRANGESWIKWNGIPGDGSFSWRQIWDSDTANTPVLFNFVDGINTLEIAHREDGALLDKLFITQTGDVPNGLGAVDSNCGLANKSIKVYEANRLQTPSDSKNMSAYPNPASFVMNVSFDFSTTIIEFLVFDVNGRLVMRRSGQEIQDMDSYLLQVDTLPQGTYFLNALDEDGEKYEKQFVVKY